MRAVSPKRRKQLAERARVRAVVLERDGGCVARQLIPHECAGPLDVHEVVPRSVWAQGWLEPSNCVVLCRRIHDWVGENPDAAHELGLHKFSWERGAA